MKLRLYSIILEATIRGYPAKRALLAGYPRIISMCWGDIWHWAIGGHKSVMNRIGNSWTLENYATVATQNIHLSQIVKKLTSCDPTWHHRSWLGNGLQPDGTKPLPISMLTLSYMGFWITCTQQGLTYLLFFLLFSSEGRYWWWRPSR